MEFLRKYGVAATINVPLIIAGSNNQATQNNSPVDYIPVAGDVKISKDEGAAANITTLPTAVAMGNGAFWKISLSATEMQAARIVITISDSATKAIEDQQIDIATYGNASAEHAFDLDTASSAQSGDAYAIVNNGTYGNSALDTDLNTLLTRIVGTLAAGTHNAQSGDVFGALPTNFASMVISAGGAVDSLVQGILNTLVTETTAGRLAASLSTFLDNGDVASSVIINDISTLLDLLSAVANAGSASNQVITGQVLTTPVAASGGDYTVTLELDGVYIYWNSVSGGFENEFTTNIGAGSPVDVKITGYINNTGDNLRVQQWDYSTSAWRTIGTWEGKGSAVNGVYEFDSLVTMVGTGANKGDIRIRLYNDNGILDTALTSANIYIDQILVKYNQNQAGNLDAIYFDSSASNTGTIPGVDGIPGNPVSTEAAVNTLLAKTNYSTVIVALESTITFATSHVNEKWIGTHWTLNMGSQDLSGSHIIGAVVSGTASASVDPIDFLDCRIGTCSIPQSKAFDSHLTGGTITFNEAGDYAFIRCQSILAGGSTPIIDTGAAIGNVNLTMPDYQQGIEIRNLNAVGTDNFSISGDGQIIYAASSSGTVNQRGNWKVTNTGGVTIVADDNTQIGYDLADGGRLDAIIDELTVQGDTNEAKLDTVSTAVVTTIPGLIDDIGIKKNTAFSNFEFLMVLTSDHVTPATGLTVTGQRSIDGGAFATVSGTITEVSNGIYQFDALAADTNGDVITWRFSSATADDAFYTFKTVA